MKYSDIKNIKYSMPQGWYKRFGHTYIKELANIIHVNNLENEFEIGQIKEKFGELRSYLYPYNEQLNDFCYRYEDISAYVCVDCGNDSKYLSKGWILPYCEECAMKQCAKRNRKIEEEFNEQRK